LRRQFLVWHPARGDNATVIKNQATGWLILLVSTFLSTTAVAEDAVAGDAVDNDTVDAGSTIQPPVPPVRVSRGDAGHAPLLWVDPVEGGCSASAGESEPLGPVLLLVLSLGLLLGAHVRRDDGKRAKMLGLGVCVGLLITGPGCGATAPTVKPSPDTPISAAPRLSIPPAGDLTPLQLGKCSEADDLLANVVYPAHANLKTYGGGDMALYNLDRGEPAAGARGVAVVAIDVRGMDEMGAVYTCRVIEGLAGLDFGAQRMARDGGAIVVGIPASQMGDDSDFEKFTLILKANRQGEVRAFRAGAGVVN
jgi:hypothetical protein